MKIKLLKINAQESNEKTSRAISYTGAIKELNGSRIQRNVGFVFDSSEGKHIVAVDKYNKVICMFSDEKLSIESLQENTTYDVEINKYKETTVTDESFIVSLLMKDTQS